MIKLQLRREHIRRW